MKLKILSMILLIGTILGVAGCGKNYIAGDISGVQIKDLPDQDIQYTLQPVVPDNAKDSTFSPTDFIKNPKTGQVILRADVDGEKNISLKGTLQKGESEAHLYSDDKNTEAFAVCADDNLCDQMIVTVYKNGSKVKQFTTQKDVVPDDSDDDGLGVDEYVAPLTTDTQTPGLKLSEALGWPTYGGIANAAAFPAAGPGFIVRKTSAGIWATDYLVGLITHVAADFDKTFQGKLPLEIGDIAKQGGGYFSGHVSHQNGLDIDIAYPAKNPRSTTNWEDMSVDNKVMPNFDVERFWYLSKKLVTVANVPFIIVDPAIKLAVCNYAKSKNDYSDDKNSPSYKALLALWTNHRGKTKPEKDHRNHFHVRAQCPSYMHRCRNVKEPPPEMGTGCPLTISPVQEVSDNNVASDVSESPQSTNKPVDRK